MHREIDAIQTRVGAVLKDFNDQMKKLFGEAQNMCSVCKDTDHSLGLPVLRLSRKGSLSPTPRPTGARPQP